MEKLQIISKLLFFKTFYYGTWIYFTAIHNAIVGSHCAKIQDVGNPLDTETVAGLHLLDFWEEEI